MAAWTNNDWSDGRDASGDTEAVKGEKETYDDLVVHRVQHRDCELSWECPRRWRADIGVKFRQLSTSFISHQLALCNAYLSDYYKTHPNGQINHSRLDEQQYDPLAERPPSSPLVRTSRSRIKIPDVFSELPARPQVSQ